MGYESLIGAIMDITTITTVTIDGKDYINEETETEDFGNLNQEQSEFLERALFEY